MNHRRVLEIRSSYAYRRRIDLILLLILCPIPFLIAQTALPASTHFALKGAPMHSLVLPTSISIKWSTQKPSTCYLKFNGDIMQTVKSDDINHEICLENLSESSKYEYYIGIGTPADEILAGPFTFETSASNQ